jgi:hypothetical protein
MPPTHWTYSDVGPEEDLSQGDYLEVTADLRTLLQEVHPHFCDAKYIGFVVATQTCDLTRRKGSDCATRYISIAAVRSIYTVLPRLLSSVEGAVVKDNAFRLSKKSKAVELLRRIVDQNEQALGLFYFHQDSELRIGDPSVAYLRVTVALKAEHYGILLRARRGRLKPEFQAKLGWLVGNLYARPATTDWEEQTTSESAVTQMINQLLGNKGLRWIEDNTLELLVQQNPNYRSLSADELVAAAKQQKPKSLMDSVVDVVADVAANRAEAILDARLRTFEHYVRKALRIAANSVDSAEPPVETDVGKNGEALGDEQIQMARDYLCGKLSLKELTQLKTELKSNSSLKQLLRRS